MYRLSVPTLLLISLALLSGCVAHRSGEAVRRIRFTIEGRPFPKSLWVAESDAALRRAMTQEASSWQSLVFPGAIEPEWLDRGRLDKDADRVEHFLAEQGYFDARFQRWEVSRNRVPKGRKMRPVVVRGYIDEGPASRVRSVTIAGLDDLEEPLARRVRAAVALAEGRVFRTSDYTESVSAVRNLLLDSGYAFVTVDGGADAFPEEQLVDVALRVELGPQSRFGTIRLVGVSDMPPRVVRDTITFKEGDPFRPRDLAETRSALFSLGVFSVVNITPSLDDPESGKVPVTIEVKRTKWHRVKAGPGLEVESDKGTAYASVEWADTNVLGRLWKLQTTAKAGIAGVVAQDTTYQTFSLSQTTFAPVGEVTGSLTIPHVLGRRWALQLDGSVETGIETGYRFFSPEIAPALTWRPLRRGDRDLLTIGLGYRLRYFDYFAFTVDVQDIVDSPLGLDLTDPYLLSMLDQRVTLDARDNALSATRGWFGSLAVAEGGGPVGGNFNFVRAQAEARGYWSAPPIGRWEPPLVVAGRLGGGLIATYGTGAKASVPYAERLYLGGGTTVRGWGAGRLGPSVATTDLSSGEAILVPAGGLADLFGNLELRKGVGGGLSVAGFTDVGRVWATAAEVDLAGLQWTVGGGLRYATVVGPIRADVGVRLGPPAADLPSEPGWTLHFGLSEAF